MARFFINRPIVAMVISILMVIVGLVAMFQLPIAQYPNIAPPEMLLTAKGKVAMMRASNPNNVVPSPILKPHSIGARSGRTS